LPATTSGSVEIEGGASVPFIRFSSNRESLWRRNRPSQTGKVKTQWVNYLHRSTRLILRSGAVSAARARRKRGNGRRGPLASGAGESVGKSRSQRSATCGRWMDLWTSI
jgi:hypothetical protein